MPKFTAVGTGELKTDRDGRQYITAVVHLGDEDRPRRLLIYRDQEQPGRQYVVLSPHDRDRAASATPPARSDTPATDKAGRTEARGDRGDKIQTPNGWIVRPEPETEVPF